MAKLHPTQDLMSGHETTFVTRSLKLLVCVAGSQFAGLVIPKTPTIPSGPSGRDRFLTFGTRNRIVAAVVETIPGKTCKGLESLSGLIARSILKGLVVNASINRLPRQSGLPETQLIVADAVFSEAPRVQHESMPDHEHIYCQSAGGTDIK